jgi:polyphosphate kinase
VLGVVTIPRTLPGLIALPERDGQSGFLLLDDLIEAHMEPMFRGYSILGRAAFRVTRNSNLYMQEEESRTLLESVAEELHNRRKGDVVRMEIDDDRAGGDRGAAAAELRAGPLAGLPHRRAGEPITADGTVRAGEGPRR